MAPHRTAATQGRHTWPAAHGRVVRHPQGDFLRAADGLPMAVLTSRLPEVENRVSLLLALAQRAHVGTDTYPVTRSPHLRVVLGREAQPSAGILESQSGQTTGAGVRGYEGAKKIKGRKRHLLVDTQGLVLTVKVHPADMAGGSGTDFVVAWPKPAPEQRVGTAL